MRLILKIFNGLTGENIHALFLVLKLDKLAYLQTDLTKLYSAYLRRVNFDRRYFSFVNRMDCSIMSDKYKSKKEKVIELY